MFHPAISVLTLVVIPLFAGAIGTVLLFQVLPQATKNKLMFKCGSCLLRVAVFFMDKTIFVIDYEGGFFLQFECSRDELAEILPDHLEPIPMTIVDGNESKYLLSLYCAHMKQEGGYNPEGEGSRAEVFTYVRDKQGKIGMWFVSAFIKYPKDKVTAFIVKHIMHFFGMCPITYEVGYPHLPTIEIKVSEDDFYMKHLNAEIHVSLQDGSILSKNNRLHRDFICANSQIYRGSHGAKNVNFFNQDFVGAKVTCWDPAKVRVQNPTDIHPLCQKLVEVESYRGNGGGPIRWYFENS
jgi:hypothetical protein